MRMPRIPTLFLIAAMVPVSGAAFAQAPSVPAVPTTISGSYSFSTERAIVIGAGALGGWAIGGYLFAGHLGPIVTGVAGGYLANMWYGK